MLSDAFPYKTTERSLHRPGADSTPIRSPGHENQQGHRGPQSRQRVEVSCNASPVCVWRPPFDPPFLTTRQDGWQRPETANILNSPESAE